VKTRNNSYITLVPYIAPLCLALITFATYLPSLYYAFQFDDEPNILSFYHIRHKTFSDLFFSSTRWISYWINTIHYKIGHFNPFVYRLTNVIFHCFSGILVYFLLITLFKRQKTHLQLKKHASWVAGITAALFLLHPIQTQTVSYVIQGQLEGLSALFCFTILMLFTLHSYTQNFLYRILILITLLALIIIACGTKEITIVLPFLALLIDWFFIAQGSLKELKKRIWIHALIFSVTWGCYLWLLGKKFFITAFGLQITHHVTPGNAIAESSCHHITAWPFFISQFKVIIHYLIMFIWPFTMCIDYDWKLCTGISQPDCVVPLLILIALACSIAWALKKNSTSIYAFGLLWFFICMAPRSTIIPSSELVADYKTYLASVGWLLLIGYALFLGYQTLMRTIPCTRKKSMIVTLCLLGITLLSVLTYRRNLVWKSCKNFWFDVVQKAPLKARGHNNYGASLLLDHDSKNAIIYFQRAIHLEPETYAEAYNNLSTAYACEHKIDLAIVALRKSLKISPYQPKSYNSLGFLLMQKQEYNLAEKSFKQAIALNPHYGKAYYNLGKTYSAQHRHQDAYECFKKACTQADGDMQPHIVETFAEVSRQLQRYHDTIIAYNMLLTLKPHDITYTLHAADAYLMTHDFEHAIALYQSIIHQDERNEKALGNLVEAYLMNKEPEKCVALIHTIEQKNISPVGLPIQKAQALQLLGKKAEAKSILRSFIDDNTQPARLKQLALSLMEKPQTE
jgi:protein O-mannosyl-transferase